MNAIHQIVSVKRVLELTVVYTFPTPKKALQVALFVPLYTYTPPIIRDHCRCSSEVSSYVDQLLVVNKADDKDISLSFDVI